MRVPQCRLLMLLLVLAILVPGCASGEQAKDSIKVGAAVSLTGATAKEGGYLLKGYQAWEKWVNGQGGIYVKSLNRKLPVKLIYYDDQSNKETGVKLYEKLVTEDKIDVALGPYGSSITYAITPVLDKYKVFNLNTEGQSERVHKRGLKYVVGTLPSTYYYFNNCVQAAYSLGCRTAALIYAKQEWPIDSMASAKREMEALGVEVVFEKEYSPGTTDFMPILTEAMGKHPDSVFGGAYFQDAVAIRKQMKQIGFKVKFLGLLSGPLMQEWYDVLGPDANGAATAATWVHDWARKMQEAGAINLGPSLDEFARLIKEMFGLEIENLDPRCPCGFGAGVILAKCIEDAGTLEADALRKAASDLSGKVTTIHAPFQIDRETGENRVRSPALQWIDGKQYTVRPKEFATHEPILMPDFSR